MAGAGVLNLPYAVNLSGWSGLALLTLVGVMSCYTGIILVKCMKSSSGEARTYQEIGKLAFGKNGYRLTLLFQNLTLFFVAALFLILAGSNTKTLFDEWIPKSKQDIKVFIGATAAIIWPVNVILRTMKEISWIAVAGMMATFFTVVVICIYSVREGDPSSPHSIANLQTYPAAFSSFVFAFGGHNVFPAIQETMRHPNEFNKVMYVSFFLTWLVYLPPCILGYLYFGSAVQSPILLSIDTGIVTQMATISITLHLWFTIPIINNPLFLYIEDLLNVKPKNHIKRLAIRTTIILVETVVACFVPFFPDVTNFIGSTTICATVFFFPCFFYLKLHWEEISRVEVVGIFGILVLASLGSVIGLYNSVVQLAFDLGGVVFSPEMWFFWTILACVSFLAVVGIGMGMWGISAFYRYNDQVYCWN
uniref:Amino acid transporter transmembrane domain-containing protein n=1 Tax=Arcella intermedia TaxID=1963864 RepID=A0A6B2L4V2_9EUKA